MQSFSRFARSSISADSFPSRSRGVGVCARATRVVWAGPWWRARRGERVISTVRHSTASRGPRDDPGPTVTTHTGYTPSRTTPSGVARSAVHRDDGPSRRKRRVDPTEAEEHYAVSPIFVPVSNLSTTDPRRGRLRSRLKVVAARINVVLTLSRGRSSLPCRPHRVNGVEQRTTSALRPSVRRTFRGSIKKPFVERRVRGDAFLNLLSCLGIISVSAV